MATTNINLLIDEIIKINKIQKNFLESSIQQLSEDDTKNLDLYLQYCLNNSLSIEYLAASYNLITQDTLREQVYFLRNKKYRYSKYEEVAGSVYMSDEYMSQYMYGLGISSFLWPQHNQLKNYFEKTIPKDNTGKYLEIGPGHGYYFIKAMKLSTYKSFEGIDISPTSIRMTQSIIDSELWGKFSNYTIYLADFHSFDTSKKYDAIVLSEVLEHVENPESFLRKILEISNPDAYIYISTCMNSPAIDHISLFESVNHLESIIHNSGLSVQDKLVIPYGNKTIEETQTLKLPMNIAMILKK